MVGLLLAAQDRCPCVKPGNLSGLLVADRVVAALETTKMTLSKGPPADIMAMLDWGWSSTTGQLGNPGQDGQLHCSRRPGRASA